MQTVREHMARFDRLEQEALNDALADMARSQQIDGRPCSLGASRWCSCLMVLALTAHCPLDHRSVDRSGQVGAFVSDGLVPTDVPVLSRQDELGN